MRLISPRSGEEAVVVAEEPRTEYTDADHILAGCPPHS